MKEPDKIYVSIGYEEQTKPFHHSIEYIRKDALMEWVRLAYGKLSMNPFDVQDVFEELIDKIK